LETLTTLPLGRLDHALDPSSYLSPGTTVRGNLVARQTLEYVPPAGRYDARAELGVSKDQNGEIQTLRSQRDAMDGRLSLRYPLPGRLRAAASAMMNRAIQSIERTDTGEKSQAQIRGRGFELEVSRQIQREWSVSILSRQRRDVDISHGGTFDLWSVGPTARFAAGPRFRLDGRVLWGWSDQAGTYAPPGLYTTTTLGRRIDYDFLGECRLRDQISLSLGWTGFKAPGRENYYTGRCELRGTF
jgi:hypothetical protein